VEEAAKLIPACVFISVCYAVLKLDERLFVTSLHLKKMVMSLETPG